MKSFRIFLIIAFFLGLMSVQAQQKNDKAAFSVGDVIAYCLYNYSATPPYQIYTINDDGSENSKLITSTYGLNHQSYSSDGNYMTATGYIYTINETWSIFGYDISTGLLQRLTSTENVWDGEPSYSPDGALITYTRSYPLQGNRNETWMMNGDGTNNHYIGVQGFLARFSPDGSKLAYANNVSGSWEIYACNIDGTGVQRLTNNNSDDYSPYWSPDGSKIVFASTRDGDYEIYVMNSDGTQQQRLTNDPAYDGQPKWSPDGTQIAFSSNRLGTGRSQIFLMNADGSNVRQITNTVYPAEAITPAWRPRSTTSVEDKSENGIPQDFRLYQNYPNPFNPLTTIKYQISELSFVTLKVYNVLGNEIAALVNEEKRVGSYEVEFSASNLPSGVYFYTLQAGEYVNTKKMILIK